MHITILLHVHLIYATIIYHNNNNNSNAPLKRLTKCRVLADTCLTLLGDDDWAYGSRTIYIIIIIIHNIMRSHKDNGCSIYVLRHMLQ